MYAIRTRTVTINEETIQQVVGYTPEDSLHLVDWPSYILVDMEALPVPVPQRGKTGVLVYNGITELVEVRYFDRPLTPEEVFEEDLPALLSGMVYATRDLIREDKLTPEEVADLVGLYPDWEVGVAYEIGDLVVYDGNLYEVVQAHTSQEDWLPSLTPALYKARTPDGIIPQWKQPEGDQDAYQKGDLVIHNDQVWESEIDANVWEPGVYGWVLYEESGG